MLAGLDHNDRLGGADFSLMFRSLRVRHAHRDAPDHERRRQRAARFCNQDGRTVWYAL